MRISYDYEEQIKELKWLIDGHDLKSDDPVYLVREQRRVMHKVIRPEATETDEFYTAQYNPIIDFYLENEKIDEEDEDIIEHSTVKEFLKEMERMNRI